MFNWYLRLLAFSRDQPIIHERFGDIRSDGDAPLVQPTKVITTGESPFPDARAIRGLSSFWKNNLSFAVHAMHALVNTGNSKTEIDWRNSSVNQRNLPVFSKHFNGTFQSKWAIHGSWKRLKQWSKWTSTATTLIWSTPRSYRYESTDVRGMQLRGLLRPYVEPFRSMVGLKDKYAHCWAKHDGRGK